MALRTLSLCAGIGGIDLGLARWSRTVCFLERDAFAASVLVARMVDRADRLRALGNAVVPAQAARAFSLLAARAVGVG